MEEKKTIEKNIGEMIDKIVDYSNRLRYTNPLTPIEIELPKDCTLIGKSVSELSFGKIHKNYYCCHKKKRRAYYL